MPGDLEPDRPAGLPLPDGCPLDCVAVRRNVLHAESHQITAAKLAIHCQVKEGQVSESASGLSAVTGRVRYRGISDV